MDGFAGAPRFLAYPRTFTVQNGADAVLKCQIAGDPRPSILWEKDRTPIEPSGRFHVEAKGNVYSLLVSRVTPEDSGLYVCKAKNNVGETYAAATLKVEAREPQEEGDHENKPPVFLVRPSSMRVCRGEDVMFTCRVSGQPCPVLHWEKDGHELSDLFESSHFSVGKEPEDWHFLKLFSARPPDGGVYVCRHRVRFQVQLADVEVQEREDAVLECHVPLETIPTAWYLEDKELQPSPKYVMEEHGVLRRLTIRDARTDDDGIYLCQMKDKGRSVAEVSVRGVIVKRLPRKLDVMEGENAAFCVETREAVEGICWSRNGQELQESSHTVLKSFGRTHLLVLVHVTREEAGVISFAVGESQTSSQLRVKCVKRDPPSTPVAARMSTEHSNAALLTWCPAPDVHHRPPSSYVLERQEVSTSEWVHCLTTDLASLVEVLGDSVPCEADYRFRVCAVNKYGRSRPVEFPGSVHLVPAARLERGLQDARVRDGEDAHFSLELSASVRGAWFLNGVRLGDEEAVGGRYCVQHCKMEHSLLIRGVRLEESGAQVTFVSSGIRDSATLQVQAQQVHIAPVPEAQRLRNRPAGRPVLRECEVSPPGAPVRWVKDGEAVPLDDVIAVQAEGHVRRLLIRSAGPSDSGIYTCDAGDDAVSFVVTVTGELGTVCGSLGPIFCSRMSRSWRSEGLEVEVGESLVLEREGPRCRLGLPCARPQDAGEFVCDAGGDSVFYNVTVAAAASALVLAVPHARMDPRAGLSTQRTVQGPYSMLNLTALMMKKPLVDWCMALGVGHEGPRSRLVLPCARPQDAGEFVCDAGDASASYNVTVAEPRVRILHPLKRSLVLPVLALEPVELRCELSVPDAPVRWFKTGLEVDESDNLLLRAEGAWRRLIIPKASAEDAGEYICESRDEAVSFDVRVSELPVKILQPRRPPPVVKASPGETVTLACELSRADAPVCWAKEGIRLEAGGSVVLEEEGAHRRLLIPAARAEHSGKYVCNTADDTVTFTVQVSDPLVRILERDALPTRRHCQAMEDLVLEVHLSHAHGEVKWYKDGEKLQDTGRVRLEEDGAHRSLIVLGATRRDAGEYLCDTRDDSIIFCVTVEAPEPPVTIVGNTGAVEHRCLVAGQDLVLACELSRPDATVRWLRDGQEVQPSERVRIEARGALWKLTILGMQPSDSGCYVCDAASDRMVTSVEVSERQVCIVQELQDACVPENENAVFTCEASHGDVKGEWFRDGEKIKVTSMVKIRQEGRVSIRSLCSPEPDVVIWG
nr:PREDICTED: obscurin-like protein 1 [Struthio camelus australis]